MRGFVLHLSIVAAALLLIGGFTTVRIAPGAVAKESITVIEHATTDTISDHGEEGDSIGDTLTFSNEVYDADNAEVVGQSQGSCTRTAPGMAWECSWTTILPDGAIVVQGPFYDAEDSTLAITGGTGKYSGATGEMQLRAREGGTEFEFVFELN